MVSVDIGPNDSLSLRKPIVSLTFIGPVDSVVCIGPVDCVVCIGPVEPAHSEHQNQHALMKTAEGIQITGTSLLRSSYVMRTCPLKIIAESVMTECHFLRVVLLVKHLAACCCGGVGCACAYHQRSSAFSSEGTCSWQCSCSC